MNRSPPGTGNVTVRHITVQQLLKATRLHSSAPFRIDGKDLKLAVLLGNPHDISTGSVFVDFTVDDGTGRIRAQLWKERGKKMAQLLESPYVRVVGELQTYRDAKILRVNNVLAVPNPYQIFEHILKAIHETVICVKGPPMLESNEQEPPEDDSEQGVDVGSILPSEPSDRPSGSSTQPAVVKQTHGDELCAPIRSMRLHTSGVEETLSPSNLTNSPHLHNPYLDLSDLERVIIQALKDLTHHAQSTSHDRWDGVAIDVIFDLVQERTPNVAETAFQ
ncbi:hypothetical protein B0H17DRAFT_240278 [Mycena rosella]|uniref:OB domain-containing protein n=1 Tax=Mycena rosella TaxID=1033263 RepID=A0AAD7H1Q9_MYCRO|nr:hypothetical protein B0H17DRAFT_240278 [Mycena rosella]